MCLSESVFWISFLWKSKTETNIRDTKPNRIEPIENGKVFPRFHIYIWFLLKHTRTPKRGIWVISEFRDEEKPCPSNNSQANRRKHFELDWVTIHLSFTVHWIRFCNITFVVCESIFHMIHSIHAMSCHSIAVVCIVTVAEDGLPLELKKSNNNDVQSYLSNQSKNINAKWKCIHL